MTLYSHGAVLRTYSVAAGRKAGAKQFLGDGKTPEGHYLIDGNSPKSRFHLALHVFYSNAADRARGGQAHGSAGGAILAHGLPAGATPLGPLQHLFDWTTGYVALSNAEIEEVYRLVRNGTPIDITP